MKLCSVIIRLNVLYPVHAMFCGIAGLSQGKLSINRSWSLQEVEDQVIQSYPHVPLTPFGFNFARARKSRQLEVFSGASVGELEEFIARGKLVVVPKRDLAIPQLPNDAEVNLTVFVLFIKCRTS